MAQPTLALLALCTAVKAAATVALVFLQVYAPAIAAGLVRAAPVAAAATVALVKAQVHALLSTTSLPLGTSVVVVIVCPG